MKIVWMSAVALALAGCVTRNEYSRHEQKTAPSGTVAKGEKKISVEKVVKKNKAMPASKVAGVSATTLTAAIESALKKVPGGEALAAEIEVENGKALIDVKIFSNGKLYEVEIDATTGAVLEVEQDDDEDDDDEEDDGDEDDD